MCFRVTSGVMAAEPNHASTEVSPAVSLPPAQIGSTTHTVNTDQRRIPLTPTSSFGNTYMFALPGDPGILLPGMWWFFAINADNVPSPGFQFRVRFEACVRRSPLHVDHSHRHSARRMVPSC